MTRETAVVVGVGPGLGNAAVQRFAAAGMDVVAVARSASALDVLKEGDNAGNIHPYDCDATDPGEVAALFDHIGANHGPLRLAMFNAGRFFRGEVAETSPEDFEACWRVGCFAGFLVGKAAARAMLEHEQGTIIFTGATASLRGGPGFVNLASPKFALRALAQSMARELGPKNIHVAHAIIDGQILSERYAHLAGDRGPDALLEPEAIAEAYWNLHRQQRTAWTFELDLRPWAEKF